MPRLVSGTPPVSTYQLVSDQPDFRTTYQDFEMSFQERSDSDGLIPYLRR